MHTHLDAAWPFPPAAARPTCLRQGGEGAAEVSPCCLSRYRNTAYPISTVFFLSANGTNIFKFVENAVAQMRHAMRIKPSHPAFSYCLFELIL
ncbi:MULTISPECIES: hypothetical protein [unclassified Herbaspirillum]|uniref:hypothetical protein n=1 Tax=unclassified Herbaspirillum TaxID=2624150 RepID=UPI00257B4893|nr:MULTISPECIES: hypothetical protein [unclassified Herbaspirillum]|tara:strand:+ start:503 stop:781 length:279 start_codon:yes stop_codon:yes gene_type:complete